MSEPANPTLTTLADSAFRRAATKVIRQAKQTGTPLILWERDEVRAIPPDERAEGAQEVRATADLIDLRAAKADEATAATVPLNDVKTTLGLD